MSGGGAGRGRVGFDWSGVKGEGYGGPVTLPVIREVTGHMLFLGPIPSLAIITTCFSLISSSHHLISSLSQRKGAELQVNKHDAICSLVL